MIIPPMHLCSECDSDYLRICVYPPAPSHRNNEFIWRVECAECHWCGPIAAPDSNNLEGAIDAWNRAFIYLHR